MMWEFKIVRYEASKRDQTLLEVFSSIRRTSYYSLNPPIRTVKDNLNNQRAKK
jgi:hypothetical protein